MARWVDTRSTGTAHAALQVFAVSGADRQLSPSRPAPDTSPAKLLLDIPLHSCAAAKAKRRGEFIRLDMLEDVGGVPPPFCCVGVPGLR